MFQTTNQFYLWGICYWKINTASLFRPEMDSIMLSPEKNMTRVLDVNSWGLVFRHQNNNK